jgi:hypothetical protein
MKRLLLPLLSLCVTLLSGCAALEAPVRNTADLSSYERFFVQVPAQDDAGLGASIAAELTAAGMPCSHGHKVPTGTQALVSYRVVPLPGRPDRVATLVLQVREAAGEKVVATVRSDQDASLFPVSNQEMTRVAVRNLVAATPGPKGNPRGSLMERETLLW